MNYLLIDDERPSRSELYHLILSCQPDAHIDEADSGQSGIELADKNRYDAAFVDVHLGDMIGTTLSLMLKKLLPGIRIVFATAYDEYALKAFDLDAVDYLMKPFDPERVAHALEKIASGVPSAAPPAKPAEPEPAEAGAIRKLSISYDKRVVLLDIDDVAYIETDDRCCVIHTKAGSYTSTQPLSYFEKKLALCQFFRIHKSYLINLQYVIELSPWFNGMSCVKLRGFEKENLPISRKQVRPLKEIFEG